MITRCPGPRAGLLAALMLSAVPLARLAALQCPNGTPPPCRTAAPRATTAPDPQSIAVLPFRVSGADSALSEGLAELLAVEFTGEGGPRSADMGTVIRAWRRAGGGAREPLTLEASQRVSAQVGAGRMLSASVTGIGRRLSLTAQVRRTSDGGVETSVGPVQGVEDSVPELLRQLAARLIATPASGRHALAATSPEALRAYVAGRAAYRRSEFLEAARQFTRALDADSTFAPAALGYVETSGWTTLPPDNGRALRLVYNHRDRLDPVSRTILPAFIGARYPDSATVAEDIEVREAAVRAAPDNADVWFRLGDGYLHRGGLVVDDFVARAVAGMERALALDSMLSETPIHLTSLGLAIGDTAMARRYGALAMRMAPGAAWASYTRYEHAVATGNARRVGDSLMANIGNLTASGLSVMVYGQVHAADPLNVSMIMRSYDERERRATDTGVRRGLARGRATLLLNLGRPAAADSALATQTPEELALARMTGVLFSGTDIRLGELAEPVLRAVASAPGSSEVIRQRAQCLIATWFASRGDSAGALRVAADLRAAHRGLDQAGWCVPFIEAFVAVAGQRPDAPARLAYADSVIALGQPMNQGWEPLAFARLWGRLGNWPAARRAALRQEFTPKTLLHLADRRRAEGDYSAMAGDTAGATLAYRHYLILRANPEPALIPQRDSVRAALARLQQGR